MMCVFKCEWMGGNGSCNVKGRLGRAGCARLLLSVSGEWQPQQSAQSIAKHLIVIFRANSNAIAMRSFNTTTQTEEGFV